MIAYRYIGLFVLGIACHADNGLRVERIGSDDAQPFAIVGGDVLFDNGRQIERLDPVGTVRWRSDARGKWAVSRSGAGSAFVVGVSNSVDEAQRRRDESPRNDKPRRLSAFIEGFSLECAPSAEASDRKGLARLLRYGLRPPFAHDRIEQLPNGNISYRLRRPFHTGQTHVVTPPGDFIRRVAALIPPPRVHLVRYHGLFAPNAAFRAAACALVPRVDDGANEFDDACRHGGRPSATSSADVDGSISSAPNSEVDAAHRKRCRTAWAILLRKVFAVDVLRCPCGGTRRITAALTRNTPGDALERILRQIGEPTEPLPILPARGPPQADFDWYSDAGHAPDPMPDYDA